MKIVPAILALLLIVSCKKKEEPPAPEPAPAPAPTRGPISGKVSRVDQFGVSYTTALSNALVTEEGSGIKSTTDENGKYTLQNVSAGTRTLSFSAAGCGTIKMQSFVYKIGDTISYNATLADIPTFSISNVVLIDTTWFNTKIAGFYYRAQSAATNTNASAIALISSNNNGNPLDPATFITYPALSRLSTKNDYNRFVSYDFLKDNYGLVKGDVIYIKIYPVSASNSFYVDSKSSNAIYTAAGTPYAQTFTLALP